MGKEERQAGLGKRRRPGPKHGRRPLAILASFGLLLIAPWGVVAIANPQHGQGDDGPADTAQHAAAQLSGGDENSGGQSNDQSQSDNSGSGAETPSRGGVSAGGDAGDNAVEPVKRTTRHGRSGGSSGQEDNHGSSGGDGGERRGGKHRGRGRRNRSGGQSNPVVDGNTSGPSATPGIARPGVAGPSVTPAAPTPAANPAPASANPTPAFPVPTPAPTPSNPPGTSPTPSSPSTPQDRSPAGVIPGVQQPPGTIPSGTQLGAPSLGGASGTSGLDRLSAAAAQTGKGNGQDKGKPGGSATNAGAPEGAIAGVTGAVQRGARQVVEVIPAYMWAATGTLLGLSLLLAAATWLMAGRARRLGRPGPQALTDAAALGVPVAAATAAARRGALAPAPVPPLREEPRLFEGEVLVTAGPFSDMTALSDFERRLAALPLVHDVRVGHFQGDRVGINLRLAGPTDLAQALRHEFGPAVSVASTGASELVADMTPPG